MRYCLLTIFLVVSLPAFAKEPEWQPALAYGGAPDCPKQIGSRTYRSGVVLNGQTVASIKGTNQRKSGGCVATAELQLTRAGRTKNLILPNPSTTGFSIADFSPDGSQILLALEDRTTEYQRREVSISVVPLVSEEMHWHNAWDLFGWRDCDAMVEPQGFLPDGQVLIRARKSVIAGQPHPNCVTDVGLYSVNLVTNTTTRLPDTTQIARYGKKKRPGFQACKTDPDIVGACFKIHGRLSAWNGTPTMRIWRTGTNRILGVHDDIMPESLASQLNWDLEAYGDYLVCPFSEQKPGAMQSVCIEEAEHVVTKHR